MANVTDEICAAPDFSKLNLQPMDWQRRLIWRIRSTDTAVISHLKVQLARNQADINGPVARVKRRLGL